MLRLLLITFMSPNLALFFPSLGGGGGSCGCAPCPPPPVCPTPVCAPITSCVPVAAMPVAQSIPVQAVPYALPTPCCTGCGGCKKSLKREKRQLEILSNATYIIDHEQSRNKREILDEVVKVDAKCNSEELRDIIIQNIDRVTAVAKQRIQEQADAQLDGRYNVICARGDFSYITNTELYCQETVGDVTCYVFKQLSDAVRARLA